MRADRLLSLLMLIQARGRMTAAVLAQELEVSERTIYRDDWCEKARESFTPAFRTRVRVKKEALGLFQQFFASALSGQEPEESRAPGWFEWSMVFQSLEDARSRLLAFGSALEVLAPLSLRLSMADFASTTAALYME